MPGRVKPNGVSSWSRPRPVACRAGRELARGAGRLAASLGLLAALAGGTACATRGGREFDWGILASRQTRVDGSVSLRVAGPFYESTVATNGQTLSGLRPFKVTASDPRLLQRQVHVLWPVANVRQLRQRRSTRFLLNYYTDFNIHDPRSRYHCWLVPFVFWGRDANSNRYAAVFPLGGEIRDFLWCDQIRFVLFPLWSQSSVKDVRTTALLWPVLARTRGPGVERARVFPFYGTVRYRDKYEKRFALWPFWTWVKHKRPPSAGSGYILFPLWGHIRLQDQETWFIIPPLIRFTRSERMNLLHCPWPLLQASAGAVNKFYLWPFFGTKSMAGVQSSFLLWPLGRTERVDRGPVYLKRLAVYPFVQVESSHPAQAAGETPRPALSRYVKLWPLFEYERRGAARRWRLLDLWPARDVQPVERCWAPFWTLYSGLALGDGRWEDEWLWGLVRRRHTGAGEFHHSCFPFWRSDGAERQRIWSVLGGLVGYERRGKDRSLRLFYVLRWPWKGTRP